MLAPTHSIFGIFLTLIILALFGVKLSLHWSILLFAVIGAILPDIDYPTSIIGKIFYPISSRIERKYGHRTITHSLIGWFAASALFALIIIIPSLVIESLRNWSFSLTPRWIAAFSISYLSHLILDMFNHRGSQLFWPDKTRDVIPKNHKFRMGSGSRSEILVFIIVLMLMFLALPVSKYGIASTMRWLLATPGSAIQEIKNYKIHSYLEFEGIFNETKEPVIGVGEILDVDKRRLVILYKENIFTISDELSADIFASKVRVKRTKIPIKVERKEYKNETRAYLLSQIPEGALVSGVIELPKGLEVKTQNYPGFFKIFEQKGDKLYLYYASRAQIKELSLTEQFELQKKKDQVELAGLRAKAKKIQNQIKDVQSYGGLTELGQELLLSKDDIEKQNVKLEELNTQLQEIEIRIEEVNLKIRSKKFVFSGSVYIRQ